MKRFKSLKNIDYVISIVYADYYCMSNATALKKKHTKTIKCLKNL